MMIILVESSSNIQNGHHVMKCAERGWSADMMMRSMTQHKGPMGLKVRLVWCFPNRQNQQLLQDRARSDSCQQSAPPTPTVRRSGLHRGASDESRCGISRFKRSRHSIEAWVSFPLANVRLIAFEYIHSLRMGIPLQIMPFFSVILWRETLVAGFQVF